MAKRTTTENNQEAPDPSSILQTSAPIMPTEGEIDPPDETPEPEEPKDPENIPSFYSGILKIYPQYQSLYLDSLGGAYVSDTPEQIRGKAMLYQNPFYQP